MGQMTRKTPLIHCCSNWTENHHLQNLFLLFLAVLAVDMLLVHVLGYVRKHYHSKVVEWHRQTIHLECVSLMLLGGHSRVRSQDETRSRMLVALEHDRRLQQIHRGEATGMSLKHSSRLQGNQMLLSICSDTQITEHSLNTNCTHTHMPTL